MQSHLDLSQRAHWSARPMKVSSYVTELFHWTRQTTLTRSTTPGGFASRPSGPFWESGPKLAVPAVRPKQASGTRCR